MQLLHHILEVFCQEFKMQTITIIGYGNHVIKNILPAISRCNAINVEYIIVRDKERFKECPDYNLMRELNGDFVISSDWVYIATPISTHFSYARKMLMLGKNVICEKPITESYNNSKLLDNLAKESGLKLIEVCMYLYHEQYDILKNIFSKYENDIKNIRCSFSIPHLSPDNIRYKKELFGGALLDVGYYPLSLISDLCGRPINISYKKFFDREVDIFGYAIFEYKSFYALCEWGIGKLYSNFIEIQTENDLIYFERIFSKPHTFETTITITNREGVQTIIVEQDDHFVNFLEDCLGECVNKNIDFLNKNKILTEIYKDIDLYI